MTVTVFSVEERDGVRDRVLELAASDARVVAGAVVGSLAQGDGDRWSDLDLTFAVADGVPLHDVLTDWTRILARDLTAVELFDVSSGLSIYRVFLLPGHLQLDLSLTPVSAFGASGSSFTLLFGEAVEKPHAQPPDPRVIFGHAVHHALRARFCIERGRYWQAEYWISGVRDQALSLACRSRDLPVRHGRGFDDLPDDVRAAVADALVASLERTELLGALAVAIAALLRHADEVGDLATKVEPQLRALTSGWAQ